jgi:signal transduction histidine kinase
MESGQRPDALDTRLIYRVYTWVMGPVGLALALYGYYLMYWGPFSGIGPDLVPVLGSILVGFACCAVPLAELSPPAARQGLLWFAAGHALVFAVLRRQQLSWDPGRADLAFAALIAAVVVLVYLWMTVEGDGIPVVGPRSLFGGSGPSTTQRLRSQYERQVRQAAAQEERNRLARELHDSIKQQIFVIQTAAATVQARFEKDVPGALAALEQVRSSAREAMAEMEAMLDQLRAAPLENVGFVQALKKQCEAFEFRTGARVDFQPGTLPASETLAPGAQQTLFRVAQEALANVSRHARARNVRLGLASVQDHVALTVEDDGSGFDPQQHSSGMGIQNMRARAAQYGGTFELKARPGGGTSVRVAIPFVTVAPREYRTRALTSGILVVLWIALLLQNPSFIVFGSGMMLVAAIGLARAMIAYWRLRQRGEAGS